VLSLSSFLFTDLIEKPKGIAIDKVVYDQIWSVINDLIKANNKGLVWPYKDFKVIDQKIIYLISDVCDAKE